VETGEFTINVLGEEHLDIAYKAGSVSGRDVDKLSALGLKPYPSKHIATPGLEGVLGFLECVVENRVSVRESTLFIAGVKAVHVRRDLYSRYGWNLTDLLPALKGVHWFGGTFFLHSPPGRASGPLPLSPLGDSGLWSPLIIDPWGPRFASHIIHHQKLRMYTKTYKSFIPALKGEAFSCKARILMHAGGRAFTTSSRLLLAEGK